MTGMAEPTQHRHHAIDYIEFTVTDLVEAKRFYADAFGWQFTDYGTQYAGIRDGSGGDVQEVGGLALGTQVRTGGPLVRSNRRGFLYPMHRARRDVGTRSSVG